MSDNGEIFDDSKVTIEKEEFENYRQKQRYYDEKYKNRETILHQQPFGSVKRENGVLVRKFKGTTLYKAGTVHEG